jgi:hypothetical protein
VQLTQPLFIVIVHLPYYELDDVLPIYLKGSSSCFDVSLFSIGESVKRCSPKAGAH